MSPLGYSSPVMEPPLLAAKRRAFVQTMASIAGVKPRAMYLPSPTDTTTSLDPISGRVWTADATMAGQIKQLGSGYYRVFNGTSNYLTTPDTADMSFVEPLTFSVFAVANVTDTAAARDIIAKADTNQNEWFFLVGTADQLRLLLADLTAANQGVETSNAAITQGSFHSFGASTNGVIASPPTGIVLYQDGAAIAQTATNVGTYAGMANGTAAINIGAQAAGTANFFAGNIALVMVVPAVLTAGQMTSLHNASKGFFGI